MKSFATKNYQTIICIRFNDDFLTLKNYHQNIQLFSQKYHLTIKKYIKIFKNSFIITINNMSTLMKYLINIKSKATTIIFLLNVYSVVTLYANNFNILL